MEIIAVFSTLLCVYLTAKNKVLCWPMGIIGSISYFFVFKESGLFAEMWLQILFLIQSIYGWYYWQRQSNEVFNVTEISANEFGDKILELICFSISLAYFIDLNFFDVLSALMSVLATYYTAKKILNVWYLWVMVNIISVLLFAYKGLYLSSILYFILLLLAIYGFGKWRKLTIISDDEKI